MREEEGKERQKDERCVRTENDEPEERNRK